VTRHEAWSLVLKEDMNCAYTVENIYIYKKFRIELVKEEMT
jgi:hypothetical protein